MSSHITGPLRPPASTAIPWPIRSTTREITRGPFTDSDEVDMNRIEAIEKNGVLQIVLHKTKRQGQEDRHQDRGIRSVNQGKEERIMIGRSLLPSLWRQKRLVPERRDAEHLSTVSRKR
jgi:hypothetical protein